MSVQTRIPNSVQLLGDIACKVFKFKLQISQKSSGLSLISLSNFYTVYGHIFIFIILLKKNSKLYSLKAKVFLLK